MCLALVPRGIGITACMEEKEDPMVKKSMVKGVVGAVGLLCILLAAGAANAIPLGQYQVYIGGIEAGYIGQSGPVQQIPAPSGDVVLGVCRYRLIWHNNGGLDPRLCLADEGRTSLYPACSFNRLQSFATTLISGDRFGLNCYGHDNNDVVWPVHFLVAGENSANPGLGLTGVVLIDALYDSFSA